VNARHRSEELLASLEAGDAAQVPRRTQPRTGKAGAGSARPAYGGVLVVDSDAGVLFANRVAREIAAAGGVLVLKDGTVIPRQRDQGDVFEDSWDPPSSESPAARFCSAVHHAAFPCPRSSRRLPARSRCPSYRQ